MVIEYIGEIIRSELAECREKRYEAQVLILKKYLKKLLVKYEINIQYFLFIFTYHIMCRDLLYYTYS